MLSRSLTALLLVQLIATGALAQEATAEFGRSSGGLIETITKQPGGQLSGSISLMTGSSLFGSGNGSKGYGATLGGAIVQDRVWFFASAFQQESRWMASQPGPVAESTTLRAADARLTAHLGDRQNLAAFFHGGRDLVATSPQAFGGTVPSSFLSLHYTAMPSSNTLFSARFSRSSTSQPDTPFGSFAQPR